MDKYTQTENQRWEALRERIRELATEPKLNYNTNKGDETMKTLKPVTERLLAQLTTEIANLNAKCDEVLADYTPNLELGIDNSDAIFYHYQDEIEWVQSFINELRGDR